MRPSRIRLKVSNEDDRFPYVLTLDGIGVTKYNTKNEALIKLKEARKKEKNYRPIY